MREILQEKNAINNLIPKTSMAEWCHNLVGGEHVMSWVWIWLLS